MTANDLTRPSFTSSSPSQTFYSLPLPSLDMDPYEQASSGWIPNDDQLNDVDELEKLEQDLMPQPDDYYGILNISKTVRTTS